MTKSRKQCVVKKGDGYEKVKATHVGRDVFDKKTNELLGVLIEPNPNTGMLRLKLANGSIITIR